MLYVCVCVCAQSYPTLETLWTITRQAPLSLGFSRQEYWSGLPFPSPGIFLTQGSNPSLLCLLHWQVGSLLLRHLGNPYSCAESEVLVVQSCPTLCDPMDCSLPDSAIHGILQARILERVAIPFSRGSSQARYQTQVSCIAGRFFTIRATK